MSKEQELLAKIRELETELKKVKKQKRYGLVWEDKPEDVVERCKKELPVLLEDESRRISEGGEGPTHILIEGDNYHALSVLAYTHEKSVDVIYIDPPYNTGKKKEWKYNDSYVDKEDTYLHSKWSSMMHKRLKIARKLLKKDGIILISIDDHELWQLKMICDELFLEENWLETFVWNTEGNIDNQKKIKSNHEYILAYANDELYFEAPKVIDPNIGQSSKLYNDTIENSITKNGPKNPVSDIVVPIGFPCTQEKGIIKRKSTGWPKTNDDIRILSFYTQNEIIFSSGWSSKDLLIRFIKNNFEPILDDKGQMTWFKITNTGALYVYKSRSSDQSHVLSVLTNFGTTKKMSEELKRMGVNFEYPKPVGLIKYLLQMHNRNLVILDFFAGSGTTGHAVLELNREDGGNRQVILCTNNENQIAEEVTYPRMRNVISGYADVEGIPANLRYYRTEFIAVDRSIDDLRGRFMGRCSEMLSIRESCYDRVDLDGSSEGYQVFENTSQALVVMYDPYEDIERLRVYADACEKPLVVYIFSMSPEMWEEEIAGWGRSIRIETIPDEILETYKKIFGF